MTDQNPRFIDNGDDTITDNLTNLVWSKKTIVVDEDYEDCEKAVAALGEGWRIPTADEQLTIVDRTRYSPAINSDVFPDTHNDWYWTSTECAWDTSAVWVVNFNDGLVYSYHRDDGACVRAVRAGQ